MTTVAGSILCLGCSRLRMSPYQAPWYCDAFPDGRGIPPEIKLSGYDHRKPFDGDNGIQFAQKPGHEILTLNYDEARGANAG